MTSPVIAPAIVVVGSGLAGITAALAAREQLEAAADPDGGVMLITKARLEDSNTAMAQGGIAAALWPDDSPELHASDTLRAGHGLCSAEAVRVLTEEGPFGVRDLLARGVHFDRAEPELAAGPGSRSDDPALALARGLEAAHSRPRIVHAGGDATGKVIQTTLAGLVRASGILIRENTFLSDLVTRDGRVCGVRVIGPDGNAEEIEAAAVVLATGGAGQLFAHTTNPALATGDGVAAAWRAGAELADLEFFQFHPTALAAPGNFLISEAVRGAGAVLRDRSGHRFMVDAHPDAELAPRDVVASAIAAVMAGNGGFPVWLDATALEVERGDGYLARRFPTITAECARNGWDWSREAIPVTPAAHYWMGGIRIDLDGRSSLPGLYAAGEAANAGVHGANRLASNSLAEALVFGRRAGRAAVLDREPARGWVRNSRSGSAEGNARLARTPSTRMDVPLPTRADIQHLVWDSIGLNRNGPDLYAAERMLSRWVTQIQATQIQTAIAEGPFHVQHYEDLNLATLGSLMARAACERRESVGSHRRVDDPASPDPQLLTAKIPEHKEH